MREIYYFGRIGPAGHFLHGPGETTQVYPGKEFEACFGYKGCKLDTPFCPPSNWPCGKYVVMSKADWTIVSWWDQSADDRPGSHSTFVFRGYDSLEEFWPEAHARFPSVFHRQAAPVYGGGVFHRSYPKPFELFKQSGTLMDRVRGHETEVHAILTPVFHLLDRFGIKTMTLERTEGGVSVDLKGQE